MIEVCSLLHLVWTLQESLLSQIFLSHLPSEWLSLALELSLSQLIMLEQSQHFEEYELKKIYFLELGKL